MWRPTVFTNFKSSNDKMVDNFEFWNKHRPSKSELETLRDELRTNFESCVEDLGLSQEAIAIKVKSELFDEEQFFERWALICSRVDTIRAAPKKDQIDFLTDFWALVYPRFKR